MGFDIAGGFDERYFMFFEDVDLGWRLNLLGWKVRYEPASVAYHRQHASMAAFGDFREMCLLERNALFTLYKNLDDRSLERVLPGALLLAVRRAVLRGGRDSTELDLRRPGGDDRPTEAVSKQTLAGLYAIDQLATQIGALTADRRQIQLRRRVSDAELRPLFGNLLEELHDLPGHRRRRTRTSCRRWGSSPPRASGGSSSSPETSSPRPWPGRRSGPGTSPPI